MANKANAEVEDALAVRELRGEKFGVAITPIATQTAITDMATTAATQTTPWGFASAAQADSIATRINLIITRLEAFGLITTS